LQVTPPWKPDITSDTDTKYIPEEFSNEPVQLTPPENDRLAAAVTGENGGELPYFEKFSFQGSRGSLGSYLSTSSMSTTAPFD
jgi:RAC serine/threonine-protein kinase